MPKLRISLANPQKPWYISTVSTLRQVPFGGTADILLEEPLMSDYRSEIQRRRTFAIISHPDAGKTTLTEKFLLYGGGSQDRKSVV